MNQMPLGVALVQRATRPTTLLLFPRNTSKTNLCLPKLKIKIPLFNIFLLSSLVLFHKQLCLKGDFRFAYVLAPKKVSSFIQDSLINHAQQKGIDLFPIYLNKPLIEQGPFDCIFHKLYGPEWRKQLEEFSLRNPTTIIVDPIDATEKLHNRISMLEVVNELKITGGDENIGIPIQIFVEENSESLLDAITRQGLHFVIAKLLIANGTADSHQMSLEFVNHGGVIFKVYVAGEHVKCVKRRSLPGYSEEKLGTLENLISFSQISNLTAQDQNDDSFAELIEKAVMPV
ncbi:Inositol-tetrakisphosphate 1-kinase [Datura stramonium]|uniref:Inositol-tetrakisphosphate 1-kinase n=1 Tax=Datura stramonium TaxID=4076 RepID=A0ABS8TN20_DATST|nr:Inositol-tetrakisphosphate 1-kinase [Datura stramonium]